jgi:hypothetical protein
MKSSTLRNLLKKEILETISNDKLNEGAWSVGSNPHIMSFIKDIERLKKEYYDIVGSDDVFNGLDNAQSAAMELLNRSSSSPVKEASEEEVENQRELNKELEKTVNIEKKMNMKENKNFSDYSNQELQAYITNTNDSGAKTELSKRSSKLRDLTRTAGIENNKGKNINEFEGPMISGENELIKAIQTLAKKSSPFLKKLEKLIQEMGAGAGNALRLEVDEDEDDDVDFDKEPTKKDMKKDSISTTGSKLQKTVEQMRKLAREYKDSDGTKKEKLKEKLKELTKVKKDLEASL